MATLSIWDGPHWELWGKVDSARFFRSLAAAFPTATTLFLEGTPSPDVAEFLLSVADEGPYLPDRNTTWPKQNLYRVRFNGPTLSSLADLAERHAEPELLCHLHVYTSQDPLLYWHDAFDKASPLMVVSSADRNHLQKFSSELGFDLWQFPRPDQARIDSRNRALVVLGVSMLVLWAAAVASYFAIGVLEWKQTDPQRRMGGTGIFGGFLCALAVPCGVALLVAAFHSSVRAIRGLRWLVFIGLAFAWIVPVALLLGALD